MKVDIVSDIAPDPQFAGGQVLERLIASSPNIQFDVYVLDQAGLPEAQPELPNWKVVSRRSLFDRNKDRKWMISAVRTFVRIWEAVRAGYSIGLSVRRSNSEACWLVLQGQKLAISYFVIIVLLLGRKRVVLHQWDPITWWTAHAGLGALATKFIEGLVDVLCRLAEVNIVPSDNWTQYIAGKGATAVRVDNFFHDHEIAESLQFRPQPQGEIHAVFVGAYYAKPELEALIAYFRSAADEVGLKPYLHIYSSQSCPASLANLVEISEYGYLDRKSLITAIRNYDVALLPYPKDLQYYQTSTFSFPSKSRVYVAAGLPIVANCRADSAPGTFYRRNMKDWFFNLEEDKDLPAFLLSCSGEGRVKASTECTSVAKLHFSSDIELRRFHDAIGWDSRRNR